MVEYKKLFLFLGIIILLSFSSAITYDPHKINEDFTFSWTDSIADGCNLTTITYPNGTISIINMEISRSGNTYSGTITKGNFTQEGIVCWNYDCTDGHGDDCIEVTHNGKDKPSGVVIVLFSILFLIILATLITLMLYTLAHFVEKDFDMKDLIFNISAYFVLWGIYILGIEYVGNSFINTFLEWLIGIGALTNVFIPLVIFVISITIWKWRKELEGIA